jgi:hypothetical protein
MPPYPCPPGGNFAAFSEARMFFEFFHRKQFFEKRQGLPQSKTSRGKKCAGVFGGYWFFSNLLMGFGVESSSHFFILGIFWLISSINCSEPF